MTVDGENTGNSEGSLDCSRGLGPLVTSYSTSSFVIVHLSSYLFTSLLFESYHETCCIPHDYASIASPMPSKSRYSKR